MDAAVNPSSPGARLRALLAAPGIMVAPGVYDGFSLRLVEQMGYKTAAISGAGLDQDRDGSTPATPANLLKVSMAACEDCPTSMRYPSGSRM